MNRRCVKTTEQVPTNKHLSRRSFVHSLAAAAGTLVPIGTHSAPSPPVLQTTLSPEAALNELIEGNRRHVSGIMTAAEHNLEVLRAHTVEKQEPFAAVLSCADSR